MLIALIGGISFLGYLIFNISVANDNERRVAELQSVKLPALEILLLLKRDVENVHQSFSTALLFENYALLDDTLESAETFSKRIKSMNAIDSSTKQFSNTLLQGFNSYYQASSAVATLLIENPEQSLKYEKEIFAINQQRSHLIVEIDDIIEIHKQRFISSLAYIHSEIVSANSIGAKSGALLIIGLVILAWAISITVIRAVDKSNHLKKVFMNTMSHELRTPINGISGAISLLESTELTAEQLELVDACKTSEQSITSSVDDILEFSGMVAGDIKIAQHPFTLNNLLLNMNKTFENDCLNKGMIMNIEFSPNTNPQTPLLGDEQRLSHTLRHLVGNAIKFSSGGKVTIHVSSTIHSDNPANKHNISISIKDEGPGIPKENLKDVFEPFHQIDGSFSRQHQGIGIGIPMCASIAKAMNGTLSIRNRQPYGLEVTFKFTAMSSSKSVPNLAVPSNQPSDKSDIKVLIVEDNEVNQLVLKSFVKKMGFQSDSAMNGQEAVDLISKQNYSIILMDCQMPVMDGFDATKAIRKILGWNNRIPIIAVTANAMEGDRDRCLQSGMDDYLKKPVSMDRLRTSMEKLLFT